MRAVRDLRVALPAQSRPGGAMAGPVPSPAAGLAATRATSRWRLRGHPSSTFPALLYYLMARWPWRPPFCWKRHGRRSAGVLALRLLVVEDDPDLNRQLATALTDAGYVVDRAFDGE